MRKWPLSAKTDERRAIKMGETRVIKPETKMQRAVRERRGISAWLSCPRCHGRVVRRDKIVGETWSDTHDCPYCHVPVANGELGLIWLTENGK